MTVLAPGIHDMPHTRALTYSRWERIVFRLTGRWPQVVVARRLAALVADERHIGRSS